MVTCIIGGGASGLVAAGAIKNGKVILLERNEKVGKKIYITGKGRCNVTNNCSPKDFLENVVSNIKFLSSALYSFSPNDFIEYLNDLGAQLVTERGGRVFPASNKSSDIISALKKNAERNGTQILLNSYVENVVKTERGFSLQVGTEHIACDNLIIACGGASYPITGSDGDGYRIAKSLSHKLVEPAPALVPILLRQDVSSLAGLTLKNVTATIEGNGIKKTDFGEMLFTHSGVSGPIILSLSSYINRMDISSLKLKIDLKPALDNEKLDLRILSDFEKFKNKSFKNSLSELLPTSLIPFIIDYVGINPDERVNSITKKQRHTFLYALKELTFDISALDNISKAIVTAGGVDVKEVNPKTMESKLHKGLYFIGEVLDVDALTGGFNIQIAASTAMSAANAINTKLD